MARTSESFSEKPLPAMGSGAATVGSLMDLADAHQIKQFGWSCWERPRRRGPGPAEKSYNRDKWLDCTAGKSP